MAWAPEGLEAIRAWVRGWVDSGRLASARITVLDHGQPALEFAQGGIAEPIAGDTVLRIYSMTKPVTAVAALQLIERGALSLEDPVSRYIPSFAGLTVNRGRSGDRLEPVDAAAPMTVWHLLTHTAGLTYGGEPGAVSRLYQEHRCDFNPGEGPLAEVVERLATIPLLFDPGTAWNYGVASDVLGRVVEVAAGTPLDEVMREGVFEPLGMRDTTFRPADVPPERLAPLFEADADDGRPVLLDRSSDLVIPPDRLTLSGGGGLLSTSHDYVRFAEMLRLGGTLDGVQVLRSDTVAAMTRNQLDGDLAQLDEATFGDIDMSGVGWGYGVSVVTDPDATAVDCTLGEFGWGGYANTLFSVDPVHHVTVVFMTQLIPSGLYPLGSELRRLVAEARPRAA